MHTAYQSPGAAQVPVSIVICVQSIHLIQLGGSHSQMCDSDD